jgi:HSP20 family protein
MEVTNMAEKTVPVTQEQETKPMENTRSNERYYAPPVDIYELEDKLVVLADMPGASKDEISIDVENNVLTLDAKSRVESPGNAVYQEFEFVNFHRQFELSEQFDVEKINADYTNGVLAINLPKAEKAKPKRIEVNIA